MNIYRYLLSACAMFGAACGPSTEDDVAAARGCRLAAQFAEAAPGDTDPGERTLEQKRALDQLPARVTGFFAGLEHADPAKVKAVMAETCPEHVENLASALRYHIENTGLPSPAPDLRAFLPGA